MIGYMYEASCMRQCDHISNVWVSKALNAVSTYKHTDRQLVVVTSADVDGSAISGELLKRKMFLLLNKRVFSFLFRFRGFLNRAKVGAAESKSI